MTFRPWVSVLLKPFVHLDDMLLLLHKKTGDSWQAATSTSAQNLQSAAFVTSGSVLGYTFLRDISDGEAAHLSTPFFAAAYFYLATRPDTVHDWMSNLDIGISSDETFQTLYKSFLAGYSLFTTGSFLYHIGMTCYHSASGNLEWSTYHGRKFLYATQELSSLSGIYCARNDFPQVPPLLSSSLEFR